MVILNGREGTGDGVRSEVVMFFDVFDGISVSGVCDNDCDICVGRSVVILI